MSSKNKKLSFAADILGEQIEGAIRKIPIHQILPTENQPRKNKDINIEKLSRSLTEEGLLQPIVVTKLNSDQYRIIAGERRYRAAKMASWPEIECKILNKEIGDTYKLAVIENIQRENLNPMEESEAYQHLKQQSEYTDHQLSEILGKSRNYITEILSISSLPEDMKQLATDVGLETRNLLVQFALAVKNGQGPAFIENFKNGSIKSVKSAKSYIKQIKTSKNSSNKESPKKATGTNPKDEVEFTILSKSQWTSETQINVKVDIKNIKNISIPLSELDEKFTSAISDILKNHI